MFREILPHCPVRDRKARQAAQRHFPAPPARRRWAALVALSALCVGCVLPLSAVMAANAPAPKSATASDDEAQRPGTTSGLPVPRFVSLKSSRINVRRGPGRDNQILWVYERKGLPVEITAESGRWRRIRDEDGDTGWVWHSMLDGRRSAVVTGPPDLQLPTAFNSKPVTVPLYSEPSEKSSIVARAELGVIAHLPFCQDRWCELEVNGYEGWVLRQNIWGTYPGENFE